MGLWQEDGFGNDEALDWLQRLDLDAGVEPVVRTLRGTVEASDPYLDASRAQVALAAAELVAALNGHPHPALPEAARDWVARQMSASVTDAAPDEETLALATRALDYVVTSSALSELWSQRTEEGHWRAAMDDLRMRLSR